MSDEHELDKKDVTIFLCGPNERCIHVFDKEEDILDSYGRVAGSTTVCSLCGQSALQEDLWRLP